MRIAILGAGSVGGNLGRAWAARGHDIAFGVRDPDKQKVRDVVADCAGRGRAASPADAVRDASVVVLATPWAATLELLGGLDLRERVVIDATNPLTANLGGLTIGGDSSGGEEVAKAARGARVVKCFNTTGADNFLKPAFPGGAATMLYAGDDATAKQMVHRLGAELGFDMVDAGPLARSRLLESFALLWITLAYPQGLGREIAFRLDRR